MSESHSFYGSTGSGGAGNRRIAGVVGALLVAFLSVAVAKPWGDGPARPTSTAEPSGPDVAVAPAPSPTSGPQPATRSAIVTVGPLPVAFTTPAAPPASATWSELRWRRLAPDDPLSLVTSVTRWRNGFVALGWQAVPPATPVWTSADGAHWDPIAFNTSTTFWLGSTVLGVAELGKGLVAVTEVVQFCGEPCQPTYILPVVSWTSTDGRAWKPSMLPQEWLVDPPGIAPLVALGPAGLVVATTGQHARLAISTDGTHWQLLPAGAFPAQFELNDLRAMAAGYVAAGAWVTSDMHSEAASLWSADGRHWTSMPTLLPGGSSVGSSPGATVASLVAATSGLIAIGRDVATPGATYWWQSPDGRAWQALPAVPPLGQTTCAEERCGVQPNGTLTGDGRLFVAARGGPDSGAWLSTDGRAWRSLAMSGDLPSQQILRTTLLPDGVLVSDGSVTWFGRALVP
jgi:hypothetical protein